MGALRAGTVFHGTVGQPTAQVIDGSLKFNGSNNYFNRTPGSTGNRRKFTASFWVKRSSIDYSEKFFHQREDSNGSQTFGFQFRSDNRFRVLDQNSGANELLKDTSRAFRDTNAWYHILVSVDTESHEAEDRCEIYVNGVRETDFNSSTNYDRNYDTSVNTQVRILIGNSRPNSSATLNSYTTARLSQYYFIDGQALKPKFFGFNDPLTGTWRPKKMREGDVGLNDGTTWSSGIPGNVLSGYPATNGFDGRVDTFVYADNTSTMTWTAPKIISGKKIEIYAYAGNTHPILNVNGQSTGAVVGGTAQQNIWVDVTHLCPGGKLETIQAFGQQISGVDRSSGWSAVRVDGEILTDSAVSAAFGTNGFYLPMDNEDDFEKDKSGKGNHFTQNNFSGTFIDPDVQKDSPSGAVFGGRGQTGITTTSSAPANYATLNPLNINDMGGTTSVTISDSNLTVANARNTYFGTALSTLSMTSGKYYCEGTVDSNDATTLLCGILKIDPLESRWNTDDEQIGYFQYGYGYRSNNGNKENNLTNASYGDSYGNGDTIGIALDLDAKTISFYKNGTGQGVAYSGIPAGQYAFGFSSSETNNKWKANFGQKPFKYAPPQGYLPLNSATARPETVISRPDQYVGIVTYVGDDATTHPITGLNFGAVPDFVWIKNRNQSEKHILHDTVRGVGDTLYSTSNDHDTGSTYSDRYKSFDLNGFTVGSTHTSTNSDGDDFSAVCWKAGGSSNTFNVDGVGYASAADAGLDGGDLTVTGASVGTKQGFSIIKYQGSGTSGDQVPHGLSQTPNLAFVKQAGNSGSGTPWDVYHSGYYAAGSKNYLRLNNDDGAGYASDMFQTPTSSFMTFGSSNSQNGSSYNYIMYCWHDVPGLQKFGSYRGNGSDDGPFIETGFRPTLIWTRPHTGSGITNNAGWFIYDTLDDSNPYNDDSAVNKPGNYVTYANLLNPLNSHASMGIDILSNGFRLRADSNAYSNYDGWDYIYGAFAAAPVSNLYGGQSNAR